MLKPIKTEIQTNTNLVNPLLKENGNLNPSMFSVNSEIKFEIMTTWKNRWNPDIEKQLESYEQYLDQQDFNTLENSRNQVKEKYENKLKEIEDKIQGLNDDLKDLFILRGSLIAQDNIFKLKKKKKENEKLKIKYVKNGVMNELIKKEKAISEGKKEITISIKNATYVFQIELKYDKSDNQYKVHYFFRLNQQFLFKGHLIRSITNQYEDYEEALKYFNGRLDYYKNKYFIEEQPEIDRSLLEYDWEYNSAVSPDNTRVGLKGY